jgi:hypothetical protein
LWEMMIPLPKGLIHQIDYNTLGVLPETVINETLHRLQIDALFKAQCDGKDLLIYILVEQQSKSDYTMPTGRLSYNSDIWASYLETHKNSANAALPPIIDLHFHTDQKPCEATLPG